MTKTIGSVLVTMLMLAVAARMVRAQDPVQVDAKHYKVDFENSRVRVLHITYGPHEKSVMHYHPASVAVALTDADTKFTMPGGKTEERHMKVGESMWVAAGKHLPENMGDKPFEVVLVELKGKAAKPAETK